MLRSLLLLLLTLSAFTLRLTGEEIPLETCDRLPVVKVDISGMSFLFLVDTAATSMINIKSFAHGEPRTFSVNSWTGTVETKAQEVTIANFTIGQHRLANLKLPAIDLSAISRGCGRRIDGILGVDLLARLGATVDLRNHTAHLPDSETVQARVAGLHDQLTVCEAAFNRADETAFADCLDPQVVIFSFSGDYYGRDAAMNYYRVRYFHQDPPAQLVITPRGHHALGDAIWIDYDMRISLPDQVLVARGTALCQKENGKWRIVHMNHSRPSIEAIPGKDN